MIDRKARRKLSSALKKYATGKIDNFEYQVLIEELISSTDGSVAEIASRTDMMFDSATTPVRHIGKNRWGKSERREIARWILFLHTNFETANAGQSRAGQIGRDLTLWLLFIMAVVFTCGLILLIILISEPILRWTKYRFFEPDVWPFQSMDHYIQALRMPILGR